MAYKYSYGNEEPKYEAPKLNTDRNAIKLYLLSFLTCGIYMIAFFAPMADDIDRICPKRDGTKTMSFLFAFIVSFFTLTIAIHAWHYQIASRIEEAIDKRDIDYSFGTNDFWGWYIAGSLIGIGPFVYWYKLCRAMNLLSADYNERPTID